MAYDPSKHTIRINGGREYLPVAQRLVWFREAHPDWGIRTEPLVLDVENRIAVFRATVTDKDGNVMAQATKMETISGFQDWLEKSETGAVGRALALCGYGTQWAHELDEGDRPVDGAPRGPEQHPARRSAPERREAMRQAAPEVAAHCEAQAGPAPAQSAPRAPQPAPTAAPQCTSEGCDREMTQGQYEFSTKTFGRALCPTCQRIARGNSG
jgi:hypothetical protein